MPATHHRDFIHQLRVLLVFIEFNILMFILMERQRRTHLKPAPSPALQPPPQPQPQPTPRRRRKPAKTGSCPEFSTDKKSDTTATSWPTSYTQTFQDTRILSFLWLTSALLHHGGNYSAFQRQNMDSCETKAHYAQCHQQNKVNEYLCVYQSPS